MQSNGEKTSGTITDFETFSGATPTSSSTQMLIVEFTVNGETYTVKSYSTYPIGRFALGDSIEVLYDPDDPATAQIDLFMEHWFTPILSTLPF